MAEVLRPSRRWVMPALQITAAVCIVAGWQWGANAGALDPFFFGSPRNVAHVLSGWATSGTLLTDVRVTVSVLIIGWLAGLVIGILIGAYLFSSPFSLRVWSPFLSVLNSVPRMVFYPFFGILFGFGFFSEVGLVVFVIAVFAILNVLAGLQEVSRDLVNQVRIVGGNRVRVITQVFVPSLAGWMISSSRVIFALALQATLISEFFGPSVGLGARVIAGQGAFDINAVWAAILVIVVLAVTIDGLLQLLSRRLSAWESA
jgi:NitT/TauT family transport system permease protein